MAEVLRGAVRSTVPGSRSCAPTPSTPRRPRDEGTAPSSSSAGLSAAPSSIPARAPWIELLERLGQSRVAEFEARALAADAALADHPGLAVSIASCSTPRACACRVARRGGAGLDGAPASSKGRPRRARRRAAQDPRKAIGRGREGPLRHRRQGDRRPRDARDRRGSSASLPRRGGVPRPDRADVTGWRARALALTGDTAGAVQALEQVLRFDASAADEARLADHCVRARAARSPAPRTSRTPTAPSRTSWRAPVSRSGARARSCTASP